MPTLRAIRTLNAIEAATLNSTTLEARLQEAGHLSEFSSLLSTRGFTRRMASNTATMDVLNGSESAINAIFIAATPSNTTAVAAIAESSVAVASVSVSAASMAAVSGNEAAWAVFKLSPYYANSLTSILKTLANITDNAITTVADIIADAAAVGAVIGNVAAFKALLANGGAVDILALDSAATGIMSDNAAAMDALANTPDMLAKVAGSSVAMADIKLKAVAMNALANNNGAIKVIASIGPAWSDFLSSTLIDDYRTAAIANLADLPAGHGNVTSIILSASNLALVANSATASEALSSSAAAVTTLATSSTLGIVLNSPTAMQYFGNDATLTGLLAVPGAWDAIFSSTLAKGAIVGSTVLVDEVAGNADLILDLTGKADASIPASLNNKGVNVYDGIPAKVLTLGMRANNIGAIAATYTFGGSVVAGSRSNVVALKGGLTTYVPHVLGFTNPTWQVPGIAMTAAVSPLWTYYDMT